MLNISTLVEVVAHVCLIAWLFRVSLSLVTQYKHTLVVTQPTAVSEHLSAFDLASARQVQWCGKQMQAHAGRSPLSSTFFTVRLLRLVNPFRSLCRCALHPMVVEPIGRVRAADEPIAHGLA